MKVTADDIAQLLASSPPRQVSDHVAKAAKGGSGGRMMILFGLGFGGFGGLFLIFFFPWNFPREIELNLRGRTVPGEVRGTRDTNMSVNETKVVAYDFSFVTANDETATAQCYTTGPLWPAGARVEVRYLPRNPAVACIVGARLNEAGWAGGFVVIFPLVGFAIVGWTVRARRRTGRLLHLGQAAEVTVVGVDATGMKINYQTVYKITVQAPELAGGEKVTVKRWGKPEVNLLTERALHRQSIFVLFDPRRPKDLLFPEGLIEP